MKKARKLFMASALTFSLVLFAFPVSAASSITGGVAGYTTSGSVSIGSSSATGYTSSSAPGAVVSVSVTYTYQWGPVTDFYTVTRSNGNGNSGVSVTAPSGHANPLSVRAEASHSVSYSGQTWTGSTDIIY